MVTLEFRGRCSVIAEKSRAGLAGTAFEHFINVNTVDPQPRRKRGS
jgi:hypothetical protein